jgi:hypothetical protein
MAVVLKLTMPLVRDRLGRPGISRRARETSCVADSAHRLRRFRIGTAN